MKWLILIGVLAVVFSGLGGWVAIQKRREVAEGRTLGLSLRPLGVLFEASLLQGAEQPGNSQTGSGGRRDIDELSIIASIADRFRTVLEESDPNWEHLPYPLIRAFLKPVERQLMRELKLSHTLFSDYASEARRSLLGTGNEQT
jgi:hypothetical protein